MRSTSLLSLLVIILFSSCQKSIVWDDLVLTPPTTPVTPTPGATGGSLLDKIIALSNTDTLTFTYSYDTTKKLVKITKVGVSSGDKVDETEYYIRDVNGKLTQHTKISYSAKSALPSKYDTVYTKIHYPAGSSNFDYVIELANSNGGYITDSITYAYTNSKISRYTYFGTSPTSVAMPYYYLDLTYDAAGNTTDVKYYSYLMGVSPVFSLETIYTYDTKVSPLQYGNESLIALGEYYLGVNNFLSITLIDKTGRASDLAVTYTRTYNTTSLPNTASGVAISAGRPQQTLQLNYFYK